ncbi:MAG: hypothetical protein LBK53_06180 [Heliobacteriaceae bacterium]|jgi:hypothetical protein|nr:hypothetical protein [Heliobacteriaceae bacterium]
MNMNKKYIKSLLSLHAITFKTLAGKMAEISGKKYTYNSVKGKLDRNTLTLEEAQIIAKILGYAIKWVEQEK